MPSPDPGGVDPRVEPSSMHAGLEILLPKLLNDVGDLCVSLREGSHGAEAFLDGIAAASRGVGQLRPPAPIRHAAIDLHLEQAITKAREAPTETLATTIAAAAPYLYWHGVDDIYPGARGLERFREAFAYTQIVGPDWDGIRWPYESHDTIVGLALQGPEVFYPPHHHKARELYIVVGGTAEWRKGDGVWVRRPPGSVIWHESNESHAMRTTDEPFLAVFAWFGDLDSELLMTA
jgi:mannose-6-phosphate isomerase-like protein (cupin superfamily)